MKNDAFGDKMKEFEMVEAGRKAMPGLPLLARLDGRAFHTFTKGMDRPFDIVMSTAMIDVTRYLVEEMHATIGYTQSDEITLAWHITNPAAGFLFDGRYQKLTSVLAAAASAKFMQCLITTSKKYEHKALKMLPSFDCRVWQVPNLETAVDVFVWREADATKNSISMAAQEYFSHKELHKKTGNEKQEMLWQKGINWNDYPAFFKRGSYLQRRVVQRELTPEELSAIPEKHHPDGPVLRSDVVVLDMPPIKQVTNKVDVLFLHQQPQTA